jgi:hypothetical protein
MPTGAMADGVSVSNCYLRWHIIRWRWQDRRCWSTNRSLPGSGSVTVERKDTPAGYPAWLAAGKTRIREALRASLAVNRVLMHRAAVRLRVIPDATGHQPFSRRI